MPTRNNVTQNLNKTANATQVVRKLNQVAKIINPYSKQNSNKSSAEDLDKVTLDSRPEPKFSMPNMSMFSSPKNSVKMAVKTPKILHPLHTHDGGEVSPKNLNVPLKVFVSKRTSDLKDQMRVIKSKVNS